MAGIVLVGIVDQILAPKGDAGRQVVGLGEGGDVAHRRGVPAAAAQE
jgi:hypothetical protein